MSAIKKAKLEELEKEFGLEPGDLTYQHRCSRIAAYIAGEGESWQPPKRDKPTPKMVDPLTTEITPDHPFFGIKILISPLITPDVNRNIYYEEELGPEIIVQDYHAGEKINGAPEEVQRMVGDYEIVRVNEAKRVTAKTTFPKIGTEMTYTIGIDRAVKVRGNNGHVGYIWSMKSSWGYVPEIDALVEFHSLQTVIRSTYPEIEDKFSGPPIMEYIDGITLSARIPQTEGLIAACERQRAIDRQAGILR